MTIDVVLMLIGLSGWSAALAIYAVGYIRAGRELKRLRERQHR